MKYLLLLLAFLAVMPCVGQITGIAPPPKDTTIKPPPNEYKGEASLSVGYGTKGVGIAFSGRYLFIHGIFHITNFKEADANPDQLNYAPPHGDYTLVPFRSGNYGMNVGPYVRVLDGVALYGSIGFDAYTVSYIPRSNSTGWYYKKQGSDSYYTFNYGGGISFYPSGRWVIGGGYLSALGGYISFGAQL